MDTTNPQIEKLLQEIASLRNRLELAESKIQKNDAAIISLEDIAKDEIMEMYKRIKHMDIVMAEIQEFIWPVVDKVFPNLLKNYARVSEQFSPGPDKSAEPSNGPKRG